MKPAPPVTQTRRSVASALEPVVVELVAVGWVAVGWVVARWVVADFAAALGVCLVAPEPAGLIAPSPAVLGRESAGRELAFGAPDPVALGRESAAGPGRELGLGAAAPESAAARGVRRR